MDEKNKLEFKEYTRCAADKSSVWQHFLRTSDGLHAQCKMCKKCAVLDVLYKADNTEGNTGITVNRPCDSSDSEDESDIENEDKNRFGTEADPSGVIPKLVYKELITKVRKIVKFLKGSPTRMDILNSYLETKSKDTTLILDCKTRWSSLADMIARFLEFKDAIQKTLIDLKEKTTFSDTEILILKDMSSSLNFIKATVEELCERKSNLLIAEIALQFMMEKLAMNPDVISGQLKEALNRRILQRRNATLITTVFEAEDGLPLREIQRQQRLEDEREQETAKTFKEQLKTKVNESVHNTAEEYVGYGFEFIFNLG
ncbi:unnamed protein product [Parnassius apollo]|uniref:(apollo) hypothetical protein n=1 Tax=Parnassius apollo TaxID=110799 RepID=A0A8S3X572_PARAO|nr:unnamed protein product [Parnassius apollo]